MTEHACGCIDSNPQCSTHGAEPTAEAPSANDYWLVEHLLAGWYLASKDLTRVALSRVLTAAKEAERLRRELEYASDDLAFLDALRARVETLEAALREIRVITRVSYGDGAKLVREKVDAALAPSREAE